MKIIAFHLHLFTKVAFVILITGPTFILGCYWLAWIEGPQLILSLLLWVSQPPGRGPVPGPGINYTGPREVLLKLVILVF